LIMECNAAAERMFGYLRSEMLGRSTAFLHVDEQHLQRLRDGLYPAARAQGFYNLAEFEMIRQNGEIFPCDLSIAQLAGEEGRHRGWVSVISDASPRKQAQEERQRLFELSLVMLCVTGVDGYFREVNPAWSAILGWTPEELKARTCLEFIHPDDRAETLATFARLAQGQTVSGYENRMRCKDGTWRWLLWNSVPVLKTGLIYCAALDVTERKRLEADLVRLATIDSLTNICNRHHFLERAEQEIQRVRRYGRAGLALMMMDLDHFKEINDRHGHEAGDKVLSEMAARVLDMLRESDVMGRLGGEEFAVLLVEAGDGEALRVAQRLRATLAQSPMLAGQTAISYTVSIGVASLQPGDQGVEDLLRRADQALYQAKNRGRNRVESA
ncbi:MAG: diguanylate cyclase, partial [Pseudomonadota bacterium]